MTAPEVGASPWIGRTIDGRYRVEALLGEGGMGAVFLAEHLRLGKRVALKMILPEHAGNAELANRFARESMLTASLEHPHIVSALDTGSLPEGGAYLVMTLAAGTGLGALVRSRPGARLACEVGAQIADALATAHARGIVHRDLKPDNVMVEVREDGSLFARILDFGIARAVDVATTAGGTPLTRLGTILGTPGYMPPEQALGDAVDHRADLYSLGVLLWEMTCGKTLFAQGDLREIALAQLTEPVPPLSADDVPPDLAALIDALLMPKKDDRPKSAAEVRDRLIRMPSSSSPGGVSSPRLSLGGLSGSQSAGAQSAGAVEGVATAKTEYAAPSPSIAGSPGASPRSPMDALREGASSWAMLARRWLGTPRGRSIAAGVMALTMLLVCTGLFTRACGDGSPDGTGGVASTPPSSPGLVESALAAFSGDVLADVPSELREDVRTLMESPDDQARALSAARVWPAREVVPAFAGHLADFELATDCHGRRDAVRALREDGDPRAITALQRMQDLPRRGCGPFGVGDCHRCMRRDVDRALERLVADEHGDGSGDEDGHEKGHHH